MNREAFAAICHDLGLTLRIAGYRDTAAALLNLEADASRPTFWNKRRAVSALLDAIGVMQDELADRLDH